MKWVTRARPKVDRIACPWLIKRFVDYEAEFLYVPADEVLTVAESEGAIPFDIPNVELGHHGAECSFDAILAKYRLTDPALHRLALIVRGADTPDRDLTPQSRGLVAIAEGFSLAYDDDHAQLAAESPVYDALYAWCQAHVGSDSVAAGPRAGVRHVLFLCPHNALRSVIAMALLNRESDGRLVAQAGGTEPDTAVNPRTITVLHEIGLDVTAHRPQQVTPADIDAADLVVALDCPLSADLERAAAGKLEAWPMPDTAGKPVEAVREVRDLMGPRIRRLLAEVADNPR